MSAERKITPITSRTIASKVALSALSVSLNTVRLVRTDEPVVKQRCRTQIKRELAASHYWFGVIKADSTKRGWIARHAIDNTQTALDLALILLESKDKID